MEESVIDLFQVDAFTDRPFSGNPAAVCLLQEPQPAAWMQQVAQEMNLSETAFVLPQADGFNLRWFTPAVEVDLCGHATLAAAHTLWETGILAAGAEARFHTRSGLLTCRQRSEWIAMDFPAKLAETAVPPEYLLEALGVTPVYVGRNAFDYLVEVATAAEVQAVQPDFARLAQVAGAGRHCHQPQRRPGLRFCFPLLWPGRGCARRPGHRVRAHGDGTLLGKKAGQAGDGGLPGFGARRGGARAGGGRARHPQRAGCDGAARQITPLAGLMPVNGRFLHLCQA